MKKNKTQTSKIAVVGAGYVGMSLATILAQKNEVIVLEIDHQRVDLINSKKSTIQDQDIDDFLHNKILNLKATSIAKDALSEADFIVIATPTNFDNKSGHFDTISVEETIKTAINFNSDCTIIIKSTIPVGYTELLREQFNFEKIYFSPEFLRENLALHDNLYPSRIIMGGNSKNAKLFANLLLQSSYNHQVPIMFTSSTEAESIKLFANTFLAMRVAYFNELDTFALSRDLEVKNIIDGVCSDSRIGHFYNNPSFGYGGYCLPKDTQQLLANYASIPQELIQAIVDSNNTRQEFIADCVFKLDPKCVGIFKLSMKLDSDNYRSSSIQGVMKLLIERKIDLMIFEPLLSETSFMGIPVIKDLDVFKKNADVILANRMSDDLSDVKSKIFSRDIFNNN
ncbi:nucleotide sugar dehydrogenase [Gammaproteobacteria bacterium]|nr:nucleotide sugar dehydrogenase [Gammaproteobacteria bacterium]